MADSTEGRVSQGLRAACAVVSFVCLSCAASPTGSAGADAGGTQAPYSGPCSWPGTLVSTAPQSPRGIDANNDFFYRAGEELRRIRCEGGEMDAEADQPPWVSATPMADGVLVEHDGMGTLRARRFRSTEVLWTRALSGSARALGPSGAVLLQDGESVTGLGPDGSTQWQLSLPTGHSTIQVSRDGHWAYYLREAAGAVNFKVMKPDGTELYSYRLDPSTLPGLGTYPELRSSGVGPGGALGVVVLGYVNATVITLLGYIDPPGTLARSVSFEADVRPSPMYVAVTSEGLVAAAVRVRSALPKASFLGEYDYGVVAMGTNGSLLWTFQGGSSGADTLGGALMTDDQGDLLLAGALNSPPTERRIHRLDPQTGREKGASVAMSKGCTGPTEFNGDFNSPCTPHKFPHWKCASGPVAAARCDASTCRWVGMVCTPSGPECGVSCTIIGCGGACPIR